ncbi:MAG: ATP-binding protein [Nannocystaceae bacterium]
MRRFLRRYLRAGFDSTGDRDLAWRGRSLAIVCLAIALCSAVLLVNQVSVGAWPVAITFAIAAIIALVLPVLQTDRRSLLWSGHLITLLTYLALTTASLYRGGLAKQIPVTLALVPALAAYLHRDRRAVLAWAGVALFTVLAMGLVPLAMGIELVDRMPPQGRAVVNFVAPVLVIALLTLLAQTAIQIQSDAIAQAEDAERERLQANQAVQLQRTDQLAMVGQLAVGVAHEVNNPLAYITANVDFAITVLGEDDSDRWQPVLDALHDAADGSRRIADVVAQLSAHGRNDEEAPRAIPLRDSLEAALRIAHNQLRHRAKIIRRIEADPIVLADTGRLTQVFLNLLINAAHSIPSGQRNDHEVRARVWIDDEGLAAVEVSDTGRGIDPELLPRVLEPFFTTKDVGRGTGLGLSISNAIVQGYGGSLSIDSVVGEGTRVQIRLPVSSRRVHAASRPSNEIRLPEPRRILLIDDDDPVRQGLARALPGSVVQAANVPQALAAIERDPRFDAIICDVMMPDQNGIDFYQQLERMHPELLPRLLFLTGGVFETEAQHFIRDHEVLVLQKPVRRRQLVEALESVMHRKTPRLTASGDHGSAA